MARGSERATSRRRDVSPTLVGIGLALRRAFHLPAPCQTLDALLEAIDEAEATRAAWRRVANSGEQSAEAKRSKQKYALRSIGCACARPVISEAVMTKLVRLGYLPERPATDVETDEALTRYLLDDADDENIFARVSVIMRARWHPAGN